jgi:hypothetical protein
MEETPDTPAPGFVDRDAERVELRELLARGAGTFTSNWPMRAVLDLTKATPWNVTGPDP